MKTSPLPALVWLVGFCFGFSPLLHSQTDIRPSPGGKRLLFVDGDDIRPEPGGKRLLFVDGDDIRPAPGGKRLLFVDGDDIRPTPGGIRLAFWDGDTLRRKPAGEILLFVDGDDIRPQMGGPRLYFLDGPKLSREQLTAVLYLLRPELFTLPAEQVAAKEKEMAENAAKSTVTSSSVKDQWTGDHGILAQGANGSVLIDKRADIYPVAYKTGQEPAWQGIGVGVNTGSPNAEFWAAMAPAGAVALGVYDVKGGNLNGTWFPINTDKDPSVLGFEALAGSPSLSGAYRITNGKLPNGGASYTGALNIDPLPATLSGAAKCYRIRWSNGATAIGFLIGNKLAVAAGWGADYEILRIRPSQSGFAVEALTKAGATRRFELAK